MNKVFVDASVLFAAAYSQSGAARDLIRLSLRGKIVLVVSDLVLAETERNLTEKAPQKREAYTALLEAVSFTIATEPTQQEVLAAAQYTALKDAPIVAAAIKAQVEYLVTYDRKHLIDPPEVAAQSELTIVTPDVIVNAIADAQTTERDDQN